MREREGADGHPICYCSKPQGVLYDVSVPDKTGLSCRREDGRDSGLKLADHTVRHVEANSVFCAFGCAVAYASLADHRRVRLH